MTHTITHPAEEARIREVIQKYELARDPEWLKSVAARHNPYPPTDHRHDMTEYEIIRQDMIRGARARRKEKRHG